MKKPYDENGMPINIQFGKDLDFEGIVAWFTNLPKIKYFDDETWVFYLGKERSFKKSLPPIVDGVLTKTNFYSLESYDREFIMRFYVDTFGRPEDWRGDAFVG